MSTILLGHLPLRGVDKWGDGAYGASRGGGARLHKGVDIAAYPGTTIVSVCAGRVSKIGYPYADDLSFRYVQVSVFGLDYRYFYLQPPPFLMVGRYVKAGDPLGVVQSLQARYPGITDHVHFGIRQAQAGIPVDPTMLVTKGNRMRYEVKANGRVV